jgi:hypothetical protein
MVRTGQGGGHQLANDRVVVQDQNVNVGDGAESWRTSGLRAGALVVAFRGWRQAFRNGIGGRLHLLGIGRRRIGGRPEGYLDGAMTGGRGRTDLGLIGG